MIRTFFASIGSALGWLLGFIPRGLRYALSLSATQIRALMCWGMLAGVAVEGLTVILLVIASGRFDLSLIKTVILYSEWLRIAMTGGVVAIAVQANSIKARIGEQFEISTMIRPDQAGEPKEPPQ